MNKRLNPYSRLLNEVIAWCEKVRFRHTVTMWTYDKGTLADGWDLTQVYERNARRLYTNRHDTAERGNTNRRVMFHLQKIKEQNDG